MNTLFWGFVTVNVYVPPLLMALNRQKHRLQQPVQNWWHYSLQSMGGGCLQVWQCLSNSELWHLTLLAYHNTFKVDTAYGLDLLTVHGTCIETYKTDITKLLYGCTVLLVKHTHNFRLYTDMWERLECVKPKTLGYAWKIVECVWKVAVHLGYSM
jgi:hypothetical protein